MARGMNKVMIIGFVEREPEIRHTAINQTPKQAVKIIYSSQPVQRLPE